MKAWILHNPNNMTYEETEKPQPKPGEVLVAVKAAGICGSDIPRAFVTGAHVHPIIIGHEFAGQVCVCGSDVDAKWQGKPVGIFPLIPCGTCGPCQKKQYQMCRNYNYLGSRCDGGFAEYVAVPEKNLLELPEGVTYEQAAMLEPMAVSVHAMRKGMALEGDISKSRVAIWGLGTIGLLLTMFLKDAGVKDLYVIGNKDAQKLHVGELGIPEEKFCDSRKEDAAAWLMKRTDGAGVDLFFECVGKNETVQHAVELSAPGGSIVFVGNPYSDMTLPKAVYWKILRNELCVSGTWNSSFTGSEDDDWHYVVRALAEGRVHPEKLITHRLPMEQLMQGFTIMRDKTEDYVKIMGVNE